MTEAFPHETGQELDEALDGIILGTLARRASHDLGTHVERFRERLLALGFQPSRVRELDPGMEARIPAFLIREQQAIFGYVFVEKWTDELFRVAFGSVVRNDKGDWAIVLGKGSRELIYACRERATSFDPDFPE